MNLVKTLCSFGIQFEIGEGERLRFRPVNLVTPEIRSLILRNKNRIINSIRESSADLDTSIRLERCWLPKNVIEHANAGDYSLLPKWSKPSLQDISEVTGGLWTEIASNPIKLKWWTEFLIEIQLIEKNIVPPWFILTGRCKQCGDVPLPLGSEAGELQVCPWCCRDHTNYELV